MRLAFFGAAICGAVLFTSVARADDATLDAVHLRNGGLYRGRVTEIVPGDHVSITVAGSNETKRVPWPEVDRVIVGQAGNIPPPPTATAQTPAASPATPAAPMVGPRARVHISSPKQVILYRRAAGTLGFAQACTSPCDEDLPTGDTYRLAGNGVSQTKEFQLPASTNGRVDIVLDPPSVGGMIGGGLLAGTGATAAYIGLIMALVGQEEKDKGCYVYSSGSCSSSDGESLRNAGLVTMLIGAALTTVGIVVFINSASTDVNLKGNAPAEAYVRTPTWKTATTAQGATFPLLFTTHF